MHELRRKMYPSCLSLPFPGLFPSRIEFSKTIEGTKSVVDILCSLWREIEGEVVGSNQRSWKSIFTWLVPQVLGRSNVVRKSKRGHILPRPLPGLGDVTVKPDNWVSTYKPLRCSGYYFLNNWPSPLWDLVTLKFSTVYATTKLISDIL